MNQEAGRALAKSMELVTVSTHLSGPVHLSGNEFFWPGGPLRWVVHLSGRKIFPACGGQHFRKHHKIDPKEGKTPQNQ